ncbi:MAG: NUDIX domain-containing protein [Clostridiales bacterium]|nr:NUDIX domain-containing protein [Clostridiales bacterium]
MNTPINCTFTTEQGKFNYRIGVVIANGRKILMARNPREKREFYYSVGGRVRYGETLEDAVKRELKEETGIDCEVERMVAVHENFFVDDDGVPYHEVSVFFMVRQMQQLLAIKDGQRTDQGSDGEYLEWINLDDCEGKTIYPEFFRIMDFSREAGVRHFITRDGKTVSGISNKTESSASAMQGEQALEKAVAYTDGSYNINNAMWGYGACLLVGDKEYEISGCGEDLYNGRQIQGETTAALTVCEKALSMGIRELEIRYDYEGVRHWAMGTWKTNKPYTKEYAEKMQGYRQKMAITFMHVKAHTGIEGNEKVDKLAKAACGLLA